MTTLIEQLERIPLAEPLRDTVVIENAIDQLILYEEEIAWLQAELEWQGSSGIPVAGTVSDKGVEWNQNHS